MAMIKAFNKLALKVPTEILAEETPQARAKVIEAFIKVREILQTVKKLIVVTHNFRLIIKLLSLR